MKRPRPDQDLPPERTIPPFPNRWQLWRAKVHNFHFRDLWWRVLDRWEASRGFRRATYGTILLAGVAAALWWGAYPLWTKHNAITIARKWLASGHYQYAADAAAQAMKVAPESPEPWLIAAELARLGGQKDKAIEYARHASSLEPDNAGLMIAWATEALRADQPQQAGQVLSRVPADELDKSAQAQRLLGELDRRKVRLTAAKKHFEAALRLDGPIANNEVPLGIILLNATDPAERKHGLDLLAKWTTDREWGAVALRLLLQDALANNDRPALRQWAEALRLHPGCTVGDMPTCLHALARSDEAKYAEVLAGLEKNHAVSPEAATQLLSWLNQIGRSADAVSWMATLPPTGLQRPPLAVAAAEALRQTADWPALKAWTDGKNWGPEADFLRWSYGLKAAQMLGDQAQAEELWHTLYSHAQLNSVHALFAGSTVYTWGMVPEAEALWWRAAGQEGSIAIDALGALARHYQQQRDADGQYRVFNQLHLLKPHDAAIGNNFAFFAALTGRDQRAAEEVAKNNLAADPHNPTYAASYAFLLCVDKRSGEALAVLKPFAPETSHSEAIALAYGLALAGTGDKAKGKIVLGKIDPVTLTLAELALIKRTLAD